jgi:hypothetical protein
MLCFKTVIYETMKNERWIMKTITCDAVLSASLVSLSVWHNFDCTVHDSCTLMLGEYVNWKGTENYFPVNYSKASIYFK